MLLVYSLGLRYELVEDVKRVSPSPKPWRPQAEPKPEKKLAAKRPSLTVQWSSSPWRKAVVRATLLCNNDNVIRTLKLTEEAATFALCL